MKLIRKKIVRRRALTSLIVAGGIFLVAMGIAFWQKKIRTELQIGELRVEFSSKEFVAENDPLGTIDGETKATKSVALAVAGENNRMDKKIYIEELQTSISKIGVWEPSNLNRISDRYNRYVEFDSLEKLAKLFYSRFVFDEDRKSLVSELRKTENLIGGIGGYSFEDRSQNLELSEFGPVLPNTAISDRKYYLMEKNSRYYLISMPTADIDKISFE